MSKDSSPLPERSESATERERAKHYWGLLDEEKTHQLSLEEFDEADRLLRKYGYYVVDRVRLSSPDPFQPRWFDILNIDFQTIPGDTPKCCPDAKPLLKLEILRDLATGLRKRGLIHSDETILWVGRQATPDSICTYCRGCGCFTAVEHHKAQSDEAVDDQFVFCLEGESYAISGFGETGRFQNLDGFRYLRRLVQTPRKPVTVTELYFGVFDAKTERSAKQSWQEAFDSDAHRDYAHRLDELSEEIAEAEKNNDIGTIEKLRAGEQAIMEHLKQSVFDGKAKNINDDRQKIARAIHNALGRAYGKLRNSKPPMREIADHLKAAMSSEKGTFCYTPAGNVPDWRTF